MRTEIESGEFNWLVINTILAGAAVFVGVTWIGRELFAPAVPEAATFGLAMFAMGVLGFPIVSIEARRRRGFELRWSRHALGCLLGAVVGAVIYPLLY